MESTLDQVCEAIHKKTMVVPLPTKARKTEQYFDTRGKEVFLVTVYGRRPDVSDALRVFATGKDRPDAIRKVADAWVRAWCSLKLKPLQEIK